MSLALDLYVPGRSWLHNLDPRVKLWGALLGLVTTFLLSTPLPQAGFFLAVLLLLRVSQIPWRTLVWLARQLWVLVLLILVLQPFFTPSGPLLMAIGPLRLTLGGLERALSLSLRALTMAFITGGVLFTTDQRSLVRAFVRLGLPYTWGLTLSLTLRFLPAIQSLFISVREAQAARGWVAEGNPFDRARDYLPVLVAVIIGTLRLSDQLTLALAARGLGTGGHRTVWQDLEMRRDDWVLLIVITLSFLSLLLWRLRVVV